MKNQYFGDINDCRKYGLIRAILSASRLRMLVGWMLTENDNRSDGQTIGYLEQPEEWAGFDPDLFNALHDALKNNPKRQVALIENTELLPRSEFFSAIVPDAAPERGAWFDSLLHHTEATDLVFLDPDNGLEVKSRPYGRKYSSKYLYGHEVAALWSAGKSLLIYQHFPRVNRIDFIQRKMQEMQTHAPGTFVEAFSTSRVVFFLLLQPRHQHFHTPIVQTVQDYWKGQITHWELTKAKNLLIIDNWVTH